MRISDWSSDVCSSDLAPDDFAGIEAATAEFAQIWRGIDKIVYSTTLNEVSTARTRIVPSFDEDFIRLLESEAVQDISIGGPTEIGRASCRERVCQYV